MSDETVVVNIRDEESKVVWITPKGDEEGYHREVETLFIEVKNLQVNKNGDMVNRHDLNDKDHLFRYWLSGTATTENRSFNVIGSDLTNNKEFSLHIASGKTSDIAAQTDSLRGHSTDKCIGPFRLGYFSGDWESGSSAEWWISVSITEEMMDELVQDITHKRIKNLKLFAKVVKGMYTIDPYGPIFQRKTMYLRPNARDNKLKFPESVEGMLEGVHVNLNAEYLAPPEDYSQEDVEPPKVPANPVADSLVQLAHNVTSLNTSVKSAGALIAVMLLLLLIFK